MSAAIRRRRAPAGPGPLLHFPLIADRMAGPHQRRVRDLDEYRQERRERVHVHRRVRRPERVPIVTQLRQAWPFAAIVGVMGLVMVALYTLPAPGR